MIVKFPGSKHDSSKAPHTATDFCNKRAPINKPASGNRCLPATFPSVLRLTAPSNHANFYRLLLLGSNSGMSLTLHKAIRHLVFHIPSSSKTSDYRFLDYLFSLLLIDSPAIEKPPTLSHLASLVLASFAINTAPSTGQQLSLQPWPLSSTRSIQ